MTLRTKLAAFHARIHSHRHNHHHHHFHLPHLRHKSSKDSKDKDKPSSPSPSRKCSKKSSSSSRTSPSRKPSNRDSLSSTSTTSSSSTSTTSPPSPILTLILPIPSHHNHTIEARVYHPTDFPQTYGLSHLTPRKAAVIAHPYASLGGSWDDPVVLALVTLLAKRGWVVATFNFCGAGNSKGKTSWTGEREREEYATVTAFLVKYVECIDPHVFTVPTTSTSTATTTNPVDATTTISSTPLKKQPIKFLLAGYSYGSLIASRTPPASRVLKTVDKDILAYATRTAYEWASTEKRRSFAMVRGAALGRSVWANDDDYDDEEDEEERGETSGNHGGGADEKVNYNVQLEIESSWLLVSPLLPPVSMFLNLPNPMSWFPTKKKKEEAEGENNLENDDGTEDERDVFAVYGTDDMFTGIGRYRNWVKGKVERSNGRFRGVEVDGAGHFWMQEEEWMVKLRERVAGWIDERSVVGSV
ncbi:hypothetical protein TWF506_010686 [Arthrobotrys conoides]|uniref:AB hydrolase-1 domain-containing protein n=1 Tax=Arthrobotrys conoides TaxID=74498 RepID=A0AAN8PC51_9PEZI